jgi:hypothetical protein
MARPLSGPATNLVCVLPAFLDRLAADAAEKCALERECRLIELEVADAQERIRAEERNQGKLRREIEQWGDEMRHASKNKGERVLAVHHV